MQAMICADSSMKQAKVQGSMATQIQGRASVLESEIKQDAGKGNTEKKEEELAELQAKAQSATAAQMSTLADANKSVEEAAKRRTAIQKTLQQRTILINPRKHRNLRGCGRGDRQRKEYGYQRGNTGDIYTD